jgi:hypothetical protein
MDDVKGLFMPALQAYSHPQPWQQQLQEWLTWLEFENFAYG